MKMIGLFCRFWLCGAILILPGFLFGCAAPQQGGPPTPRQGTAQTSEEKLPAPLHVRESEEGNSTQRGQADEKTLEEGLDRLAEQLTSALPQDKKLLVAVLDFNDLAGNVSAFGRLVNEELVTKLFQTRRVRVVERGLLEKALEELKFNLSEVVDPSRAKQLGKQVGADAIVTGTITDLGNTVKINARLIGVEKGDILSAAGAEVTRTQVIAQLMGELLGSGVKKETTATQTDTKEPQVAKSNPQPGYYQDFPKLRVKIEELRIGKDQVTTFLTYTNKTNKDLVISLIAPQNREISKSTCSPDLGKTFLLDNKNNRYPFLQGSGLSGGWSDKCHIWSSSGSSALTIPSKSTASATLTFRRHGNNGEPKQIDFVSEQSFVDTQKRIPHGRFTISIRNVESR